ncbi:RNA dependent RNA polymerase-domain-containing protein [Xylaria bambusicola]|uniref:RNA dependent RNA polymerase-domain-containing protein n=1 Tax=Xylaria bambusicola TaxID=326684 RepID=UPI0020078396|nr:RNA dependent RNA polymerase-domain-containing protein [Xylaria bambusicola]KAI0513140.1 RNA dependent RNA polymerase-domain-containing protein [Xylaria bambusicola]
MSQNNGFAVYMANVPPTLTERTLTAELTPFLDQLGIRDWICDKPRDRTFGILTFLYRKDGQTFLNAHGEERLPGASLRARGEPRMRARLSLLSNHVFCRESDREPDQTLLKVLEMSAYEREHPPDIDEEPRTAKHVVFDINELSCGHYDYPNNILTYTADIQWRIPQGTAKFARDTLIISYAHSPGQIRLEIPYRTIDEVVISGRPPSLFLTLWEPPKIFLLAHEGGDIAALTTLMGRLVSNFSPNLSRSRLRERLSKIPHSSVNHGEVIGQSLIYSIVISPEEFAPKIERLKENEYLKFTRHNVPIALYHCNYMAKGLASFKSTIAECSQTIPFDILYQFQGLVQNGYLLPHIAQTLLLRLQMSKSGDIPTTVQNLGKAESGASLAATRLPFSSHAVKKLFSQIPFPGPYTEAKMFDVNDMWSLLESNEKEMRQGLTKGLFSDRARQNLTMVYKVQVTPTRILFRGPEPEAKNRILRKFPRHTGYFARIQFCDEDGQDIFYNAKVSLDKIYSRFNHILNEGFSIAGRIYKFLGFSHSSLRSHAVWFMAAFIDDNKQFRSYVSVILELGDFQGAARIGQAFSETPIAVDLEALGTEIIRIPDVKSKNGNRVFSDGVGTISRELLEAIREYLPQKSQTATCLQIRWAGAKGMLSLDDTLKGNVMCVRESMLKFESPDTQNLEICDVANKPIPLVLNRQMIKILEDMTAPESWFFKAQNRELNRLRMITATTENTVKFLRRQKTAEQMRFSQFIQRLHRIKLDYKKDAFLCSVVEAVVLREVRLLKHKSRIPVEQGVTLFGVMDEFGYLGDEEVFITFDKQHGLSCPDLDDRLVIVTRSPALHPGDIQIRRAITPPPGHPLCSLSNCIVFSQKGNRDLPSQLSGGDLDGDIYNVIWDPILVDGCKLEFEPADYPRVPPLDIGRNVRAEDMTEFFVKFMATDQLGVIAVKHMILADLHDAGAVHDECTTLAEMHSTAVDYSKTGIPVNMRQLATMKRTKDRPDFLAPAPPTNIVDRTEILFEPPVVLSTDADEDDDTGPKHRFYRSIKILGKLYRAIDEKKIWKDDIHLPRNRSDPSLWDEIIRYIQKQCDTNFGRVDWQRAKDNARRIRQAYEDAIWSATVTYSDHASKSITELEVFTGAIFNKSGIQTRRQRDTSIQLKDDFDRIVKWVESLIRKQDMQSSTDNPEDATDDDTIGSSDEAKDDISSVGTEFTPLELSIACLRVGVVRTNRDRYSDQRNAGNFESFKVIAAHCALRELDLAIQEKDIANGAAYLSGGFPGVRSGRHV